MNQKLPYFRLGVFILLALAATIVLVLVLGAGSLFRKQIVMESYFNESVQGLEVGSKVMFRGVMVGNVTLVTFTYAEYELDRPLGQRMPLVLVRFQVRPKVLGRLPTTRSRRSSPPKCKRACACARRRWASPGLPIWRSTTSTRRPTRRSRSTGSPNTSTSRPRSARWAASSATLRT